VNDEQADGAVETRVAALAREIADVINAAQAEGREGLREDAVSILRDEVQILEPPSAAAPAVADSFNPFGIGIPLVLMGGVMVFLFPPVGLLLFAVAGVVVAWGLAATLLAHR